MRATQKNSRAVGKNGENKEKHPFSVENGCFLIEIRQLPILPYSVPYSTFGNAELNFCVRNGNRWILVAIITGMAPLVGLEGTMG